MMDEREWLAQRFEAHRAHMQAVAFRLLGSTTEADDAVQEAWLRVSRAGTGGVENLGGWLTTVVSRVCLNMLDARRSRREEPLDLDTPEPVVRGTGGPDPAQEALLADAVGPALLVVLETLEPAERLAFVLHDVFGVPFDEIATIVGRSPVAARQLAGRAQRRFWGVAGTARSRRRAPGRPHRRGAASSATGRRGPRRDGRRKDLHGAGAGRANRRGGRSGGRRLGFGRYASRRL
jgi:RNA polymerase sigma factor (sigma-70 family)